MRIVVELRSPIRAQMLSDILNGLTGDGQIVLVPGRPPRLQVLEAERDDEVDD